VGSLEAFYLVIRFSLELAALASMAYWGWVEHAGVWRWVMAVGTPLLAAAVWGTFRVPGDPGDAAVPVPGVVRLVLEAILFAITSAMLYAADRGALALGFALVVLIHYALGFERVRWLLAER
jgi:hypothetical protein